MRDLIVLLVLCTILFGLIFLIVSIPKDNHMETMKCPDGHVLFYDRGHGRDVCITGSLPVTK